MKNLPPALSCTSSQIDPQPAYLRLADLRTRYRVSGSTIWKWAAAVKRTTVIGLLLLLAQSYHPTAHLHLQLDLDASVPGATGSTPTPSGDVAQKTAPSQESRPRKPITAPRGGAKE